MSTIHILTCRPSTNSSSIFVAVRQHVFPLYHRCMARVKAKKVTEIHNEAEINMGLRTPSRPPATVVAATLKAKYPVGLKRKTVSLLDEYFSVCTLALQCLEELKSPDQCHSELVKDAVSLALEKSPPCIELLTKLLDYLLSKKVLTRADLITGCLSYGSLLDDIAIDLPKAPNSFGEIMGHLVLSGGLDFKVVADVLKTMEDDYYQKVVFAGVKKVVSSSSFGSVVLASQASDVGACESLFQEKKRLGWLSWLVG